MPSYKLKGVNVSFPFDAYDCQLVYMEYVIGALQKGENALLESPTGTGKTLCLLCASLAWRESLAPPQSDRRKRRSDQGGQASGEDDRPKLPTIVYASRTHSQIQQVIHELKATTYRPKMVVLGSREQLCIHPKVHSMRGRAQNHECRRLCKTRSCPHHTAVNDFVKKNPDLGDEPLDIEDFVKIGKTKPGNPCPYFVTRELHGAAELIFVPYNYLVDKENRKSLTGIHWENSVIIFDEAHNLESICADAASFDLPASVLTSCVSEAGQCIELASQVRSTSNAMDKSVDPESFALLKALFMELEKKINDLPIDSEEVGFTRPGQFIYEFLAELKITWETMLILNDTIDYAISLLQDETTKVLSKIRNTTCKLETFRDVLRTIFREKDSSHARFYRFHVHASYKKPEKTAMTSKGDNKSRMLSWWCFNPGIAMEEFSKMGVRSIILTSGTLSPLESFAIELKIPFNVRLENPHVIGASQIWVGVVSSGPSGRSLNSSYRTRDSLEYKSELGNTIVNFARIVPDGLLVFFPSYYLLNSCIDAWQTPNQVKAITVWDRICKHKQPVVEPKESAHFNQAHEDFLTKLKDPTCAGAVFFAVCRGKVSEGLDFADQTGRAVIITGIPFAMKTDPKVRLKREYLDELARSQSSGHKALKGEEWYVQQASRAVNQAVGRVIRHKNDYGAIILCDERFAQGNTQGQLSLWLRPHLKFYSKFGDAAFTLTRFFKEKNQHGLVKPLVSSTHSPAPEVGFLPSSSITPITISSSSTTSKESVFWSATTRQGEVTAEFAQVNASFMERKTIESESSRQAVSFLERRTIEPLMSSFTAAPAQAQQPLSELLAAKRNQRLSSVGITPANRASGSTSTEFVFKSETKRSKPDDAKGSASETKRLKPDNAKSSEEQAQSTSSSTEMRAAGAYLKEVSARLSKQEYQRFLSCMKEFKEAKSNLETVLKTMSGLFAAPERKYLFSRFGDFLPKQFLPEFNEYLSGKE